MAWIALLFAALPVLADLGRHLLSSSWAWYALVFPALAAITIRRTPPGPSRPGWALVVVAAGLAIQGWGIASGELRTGRIGVLLAVVGLLLLQGRASVRPLLLLALCIPVPRLVLLRLAEPPTHWIAQATAWSLQRQGTPALAHGSLVERGAGVVSFNEFDIGIQTAILAGGLAWGAGLMRGWPTRRLCAASVLAGACGIALHVLLTALLLARADAVQVEEARRLRDVLALFGPLGVLAFALGVARGVRRRRKSTP